MEKQQIIEASKILFDHKLNKTGLDNLNHLEPKNLDDAYKIQDELKIHYLSLKNNICIGRKIGCTSKAAQTQMNVTEPFYGNLFSKYSSKNVEKLNSKYFFEPFAEPEISFRIKDDIDISKAPYSMDNIKNLLDGILCSIEIVDFRFNKPLADIGAINLVSTNGASDYWIYNDKIYNIDEIGTLLLPVPSTFVRRLRVVPQTSAGLGGRKESRACMTLQVPPGLTIQDAMSA